MKRIGASDLEIFPLGLGGNTFGNTTDAAASEQVLDTFVEGGGNFIDTADQYSFWVPANKGGESETILGEWLRRRGNRQNVISASKVGGLPSRKGLEPNNVTAAIEDSLRRLQTDYIDLYYAHYDDEERPMEEIVRTFDELVRAGKVREIAISNMAPSRIEEWLRVAKESGAAVPVALQPEYNLVGRRNYEENVAPVAKRHGLAVFPFFGLASGFLTGKYRTKADLERSSRGAAVEKYMDDAGFRVVDALAEIATARGAAMATVALAWLLAKPTVTAPLASATSREQLRELMAAPELSLTSEELSALDSASAAFA